MQTTPQFLPVLVLSNPVMPLSLPTSAIFSDGHTGDLSPASPMDACSYRGKFSTMAIKNGGEKHTHWADTEIATAAHSKRRLDIR